MTHTVSRWGLAAALIVALATSVAAQNDRPPASEPGTELDGLVGAAANHVNTGPLVGGIASWRINGWSRAEARGAWLVRGTDADAFTADLGAAARLVTNSPVRPYVGAGFGLYRAAFASETAPMSEFYRARLMAAANGMPGMAAMAGMPPGHGHHFTDPAFRLSAGLDWRVAHHLSVRPEVSALFVRRDGRGETVALVGLRVGYRFVDRTVTP